MKGNKLQQKLKDLGYETDNTDWDSADSDEEYMTKSEQEAETLGEYLR